MCGLVMVITKRSNGFTQYQKEIFDELLFIDTFRGDDSTGAFVVDNIGNVKLAKSAEPGPAFMLNKEYQDLRSAAFTNGWAMVGHNRKATRGTITDENAHPFVVDNNIVLVHNGSFNGDHRHIAQTNVDSEAIAHALHEEADPELALRKVNAAYALIWYNVDKKEINVVRNMMRPLLFVETADEIIYASEKSFLDFVVTRHSLKVTAGPTLQTELMLATFKLGDNKLTTEKLRLLDCSYYKHNSPATSGTSGTTFREYPGWEEHEDLETEYWLQQAKKHEHACGWTNTDDTTDVPFKEESKKAETRALALVPPEPHLQSVNITSVKDRGIVNKLLQAIYPNQTTMKYKDWYKIKDTYVTRQRIRVVVNDVVEADNDPKTNNFLMIGRTLDNPKVYVTFHFKEDNFETVVASAADGVFEVDVDNCIWRRTCAHDDSRNIEDFEGVTIVHASNPSPLYLYKDVWKSAH